MSRLEHLALAFLAASLTAIWLGLWVAWSLYAWLPGSVLPSLWPAGLALAGLLSAVLTDLVLGPSHGAGQIRQRLASRAARLALAGAGAAASLLLLVWALGPRAFLEILYPGPRLAQLLPAAVPSFLAALLAWWRGQQLGRAPLGNQALRANFTTGIVALAPLLVLNSLLPVLSSARVLGHLLLFFALGLSGLALSSLRRIRQQQRPRGPAAIALTRQWIFTSSAVIGLVLSAGLLMARLAAPQALQRLTGTLSAMLAGLGDALALVLVPLAAWLDQVLAPVWPGLSAFLKRLIMDLALVIARLQGLVEMLARLMSFNRPVPLVLRRLQAFLASPVFQVGARWVGLFLLLAGAAFIFWLAARRLWGSPGSETDELRDSVLSARLVLAQLRGLLRRRPRRSAPQPAYLSLAGAPDDARLIVRRAYQAMLEWAQSLRLPRAAGQTPRAYAQMLAGAVPEGHDAIDLLTQAYVLARYAAEAPSLEQARRAEGALARLQALHS